MTDKNKIEVAKIDIRIGDKTISLKPDQAKELKKILNEMFEETRETVVHEHHYRYWWNQPIITSPYVPYVPSYPQWTITCGGNSSTGTGYSSMSGPAENTVTLALN